jgi:signal transduction histidine kinase
VILAKSTGTFRLSLIFSAACVLSGVMLFATIYWRTKAFEMKRIAAFVSSETHAISQGTPDEIIWSVHTDVEHEYHDKYHNMTFAALFTPTGRLIAGDLERIPADLPADGRAHDIELRRPDIKDAPRAVNKDGPRPVIAVACRLANGDVLVIGRGLGVLNTLEEIVVGALLLGAIPAIGPALATGVWLSRQAQRRIKAVNLSIERIMQGAVHERLPVQGVADDFDHLAGSVNRMLAEIERLIAELQGVGDNIAHDLRTPLARVRTLLERGREKARTPSDMTALVDRAIVSLDQTQAIITALLRIGEIEGGQRRAAFSSVDLSEIAAVAADLYAPMAEEKRIRLILQADATASVYGDRDLLIEAIANLIDNAIKFAPVGGQVGLAVADAPDGPVICVTDSGCGIPSAERAAVMKRFYRVDKSRHIQGSGLGLSIVLAIMTLHDFDITVADANPGQDPPGCLFEIRCSNANRGAVNVAPVPTVKRMKWPLQRWRRPRRDDVEVTVGL